MTNWNELYTDLEMAQKALRFREQAEPEHKEEWRQLAIVYATVAQAEQLKRIADALETANKIALLGTPRYRNAEDFVRNIDNEIGGYT